MSSTSTRLLHTWIVIDYPYIALTLTLCVFNWIFKNPHSAFAHFINKLMIGQEYLKKTIYSPPVHWFLNTRNGSQALVCISGRQWPESLHAMSLKHKLCLGIAIDHRRYNIQVLNIIHNIELFITTNYLSQFFIWIFISVWVFFYAVICCFHHWPPLCL